MSDKTFSEDRPMVEVEFHFLDVFTGESLELRIGHEVKARFVLRTRFQIGLAHLERMTLPDGEEVTLLIENPLQKATVKIEKEKPYVLVRIADGNLLTETRATSPGYL